MTADQGERVQKPRFPSSFTPVAGVRPTQGNRMNMDNILK